MDDASKTGIELAFDIRFDDFSLDVSLALPGRGVTALFGHSGSGKTTLLRAIAGMQRFAGDLTVQGEQWQSRKTGRFLPIHRRPIGYVFQEASLFPHLDVRANLLYGYRRIAATERHLHLEQVVEWLGIGHLLERDPARLSGGERQRVAIGRTLLTSPRLLLMDEPLSALDERSKSEILPYLERLHEELAIPVIYVSHALQEVVRLADHMVWLEKGRVRAQGPLQQVLSQLDVAADWPTEEVGSAIDAVVAAHDEADELTALDCRCGRLWVQRMDAELGSELRVRLPARDISLSYHTDEQSSILNVWPGVITELREVAGGHVLVRLQCPDSEDAPHLLARITRRSARQLGLRVGETLFMRIKSVGLAL